MRYENAAKLHHGDQVRLKETGEILTVIDVELLPENPIMKTKRQVIVFCDNGEYYSHNAFK